MHHDTFDQQQQQEGEGWGMQMKQKKKTHLGKADEKEQIADVM